MSHLKYGQDRFGSRSARLRPRAILVMAKFPVALCFGLQAGHAKAMRRQ